MTDILEKLLREIKISNANLAFDLCGTLMEAHKEIVNLRAEIIAKGDGVFTMKDYGSAI